MKTEIISTVLLPFLGTVIGSGFVFFLKGEMSRRLQRSLMGFAAGVMVAASVWSLIIPAMNQSEHMGKLAFLPAFIGVWGGFLFLLALDHIIPHLHLNSDAPEGMKSDLGKNTMMVFAVALLQRFMVAETIVDQRLRVLGVKLLELAVDHFFPFRSHVTGILARLFLPGVGSVSFRPLGCGDHPGSFPARCAAFSACGTAVKQKKIKALPSICHIYLHGHYPSCAYLATPP